MSNTDPLPFPVAGAVFSRVQYNLEDRTLWECDLEYPYAPIRPLEERFPDAAAKIRDQIANGEIVIK